MKSMEFDAKVRLMRLEDGESYKSKNPKSVEADKIFERLVMRHKAGQITDDQYFDEVWKYHKKIDSIAEVEQEDEELFDI